GLAAGLAARGAEVRVVACDAADRAALAGLLARVPAGAPLTGVVHAAGVLDDATIGSLTPGRVDTVMRPKADAAWNLHQLTGDADLQAFTLFGSTSATFGNAGQGNYAAANAFLDGLAAQRRACGQPACSLAWGLWADASAMTGHLSQDDLARVARGGVAALTAAEGLALLDLATTRDEALLVPARLDVAGLRARVARGAQVPPLLHGLTGGPARRPAASGAAGPGGPTLRDRLAQLPAAERDRALLDLIRVHVAAVLGHASPEAIEPARAFSDIGFDSLTAVELRNRLTAATGLRLPATLVFDYPSPVVLARQLRADLLGDRDEAAPAGAVPAGPAPAGEPIAIVSMGCRFPGGVAGPDDLWELLAAGGDAISDLPADRGWDLEGLYHPDPDHPGTSYTRAGGFVHDATEFDAGFFGISPREAVAMDPQQRLLLETSWETLEQAGVDPHSLRGSATGVFAGAGFTGYSSGLSEAVEGSEGYLLTGNAAAVISGRVSYTLGLEGPAVTVDTACSSSLVALHLACQSLRAGECELALAGGVMVMAIPAGFVEFSRQRGLATDGRCKAFAAAADGIGWSEGAGMVLLERLSDARRNGHPVLALVRGSAINQDGASNGLTAPNGPSQQRVIRAALASAGLRPQDVDAVEAHGTGTVLGDPIEAQALLATYGQGRPADLPLWLGSVKSNIGHAQTAAGVAGVIKAVLALRHQVLPRTLHAEDPSPHVDWSAGTVRLLTEARPWPAGDRPRRAGVSAFGVSGTNVHAIVEEAPAPPGGDDQDSGSQPDAAAAVLPGARAWIVSGRTAAGLAGQAARLASWVAARPELDPADVAWSLVTTRPVLEHRAVVTGADRSELTAGLRALAAGAPAADVTGVAETGGPGRVVFVFPGQGGQWAGMGRELAAASPVFAARLAECGQALARYVDWDLAAVLAGADGAPGLDRADVVQPALWALMVSLAAVWEAAGVTPDAVVGHSQGEIAAATVAGVLSLDHAAMVVARRSQALMALAGRGAMVSVAQDAAVVRDRIAPWGDRLAVAAVNGPSATVVSGEPAAVRELAAAIEAGGVRARVLPVDYASHGAQVEQIRAEILAALDEVAPGAALVPMLSAMSGEWLAGPELGGRYWYESLRAAVEFDRAVRALAETGHRVFVEVSPHPVLIPAITQTLETGPSAPAALTGTLRRDDGGPDRVLAALAELHVRGASVDWARVLDPGRRAGLPTYAFQRQRYWPPRSPAQAGDVASAGLAAVAHPLLAATIGLADGGGLVLTGRLCIQAQPWLADHALAGRVLLPGTAFAEMAICAGDAAGCGQIVDLTMEAPLVLPDHGAVQAQVMLGRPDEDGQRTIEVYARTEAAAAADGPWQRHASGLLAPAREPAADLAGDLAEWPPPGAAPADISGLYAEGCGYGPAYQGLRAAWRRGQEMFAEVALPAEVTADGFGLHPALLDACLQAARLDGAAGATGPDDPGPARMPFAWSGVSLYATGAQALRVRLRPAAGGAVSLVAADSAGAPVVSVDALVSRPVTPGQLETASRPEQSLFTVAWTPVQPGPADTGRWAVAGPDEAGLAAGIAAAGRAVQAYPDLSGLAEAVRAGEPVPEAVLVWAGAARSGARPGGELAEAARTAAGHALGVVQEWLALAGMESSRLVLVTAGAVAAEPGEGVPDLAAAAAWGLVRSAQSEHPGRLMLADLPAAAGPAVLAMLPAALGAGEPEVAIRGGRVLGRRLTLPGAGPAQRPPADRTRPAGTVLITGGTGMLGGLVAGHLAQTGRARRLVLASRSGPAAPQAAALAAALASRGVAVQVAACDVTGRAELAGLLARVPAGCPLTGVVHTAGVLDDGVVGSLSADRIAAVMRPKADAAWHLHELTQDADLEMFVLFSSIAAVIGSAGQGSYVAGNAFLDGLAAYRRAAGLTGMSLAWGLWMHRTGIGRQLSAGRLARISRSGMIDLSASEGLALLEEALSRDEALLVPVRLDAAVLRAQAGQGEVPPLWRSLAASYAGPVRRPRPVAAAVAGPGAAGELRRQLAALAQPERDRMLVDLVRGHAAAVLGHQSAEAVAPGRVFSEIGFDSLTAVELRNRLHAATGLRLPATLVFDYPSPVALAARLGAELLGGRDLAPQSPAALPAAGEPVAIVAVSCRFPGGVTDPEGLWELLAGGRDAISGFPADRGWDTGDQDPGSSYTRAGGFVSSAPEFDAGFFGISPREALAMDPQQRLLLEVCWEAVERAGIAPASLRGSRTGVYAGALASGYGAGLEGSEGYLLTGSAGSAISGRVSYALGLEGPAVTVDTACSSSLVALHLASAALRAGECDLALAGGVMVMATPGGFTGFAQQGGLAADGRCKSFAAAADGVGLGEGAGMVVLERLSDARRNGHWVHAVVAGSAVNQDGASNGLTAPNGPSQQRVIRAALATAGLRADQVDVVEAHGSGTALGDPTEAEALIATYGQGRPAGRPLRLGSVKSNLGHTQAAAGVAGVIKMVLALQHGLLPGTLHADQPSPHVDWASGAVRLLTGPEPWPAGGSPRRAGVSAFGISGTNAHAIIADAPADDGAAQDDGAHGDGAHGDGAHGDAARPAPAVLAPGLTAWPVSGRTAGRLQAQASRLAGHVAATQDLDPGDVGWSLATTRSAFEHRAVVLGSDQAELTAGLAAVAAGEPAPGVVTGVVPALGAGRVGFVFAGQGSQRAGMGAQLHAASPVFAAAFDQACALLEAELGVPVAEVVLGGGEDDRADQTLYAQAGLFAVEAGLVALLAACGITPDAVAGHSVGEVTAAYAAGVLSLEDACRLVAARARLMQALPGGGAMTAVAAAEAEVTEVLEGVAGVSVAAVNGPSSVVVSGDAEAVG
ncbi:MAG TPA: beta-ketoacyl synthase N-terminal-like domain-containing protein, partial [Streptosporangiaceae bacterium]